MLLTKIRDKLPFVHKKQIIEHTLEEKVNPTFGLYSIAFALETISEMINDLTAEEVMIPMKMDKVFLFSDSMVALNWVFNYSIRFKNFNSKNSFFVRNKLLKISELTDAQPVSFRFIAGKQNPSDLTTRVITYRQYCKSNFLSGN